MEKLQGKLQRARDNYTAKHEEALRQLDQLEKTKDLLEKANARVEDLTVQLAAKTELERYAGNASFILLCNKLQNAAV